MADAQVKTEKGPSLREINQSPVTPLYKFRMIKNQSSASEYKTKKNNKKQQNKKTKKKKQKKKKKKKNKVHVKLKRQEKIIKWTECWI